MKNSNLQPAAVVVLMAVAMSWIALMGLVDAAQINIKNQCPEAISACKSDQSGIVTCFPLAARSGSQLIDVGTTWLGGLIWGYPGSNANPVDGNNAKPQADLAEITINGFGNTDSYDLSNVNAYNLGLLINPTTIAPPGIRSGLECGTPICSISDINSFCRSPNTLTPGPGDGCFNVDGPGRTPTSGTEAFANACSEAISFSTDTNGKVYGCTTGSNYEVVFCPANVILNIATG